MRGIGVEERRARLVARHHLGRPASSEIEVARALVALHATDPSTVYLSLAARVSEPSVARVEQALYEDRTLVRMLGMRRTMFVVPTELVPVVQAASTAALVPVERRRSIQLLEQGAVTDDGARWLRRVEKATMAALEASGGATAAQLGRAVPELQVKIPVNQDKNWAGTIGMSSRVLLVLAAEGRIVRGRPQGSWISSQYRWTPMDTWLPDPPAELSPDEARVGLARRWLAAFGPAPLSDLRWWTGWTAAQARQALTVVEPVEVDLDGAVGLVLPGDEGRGPARGRAPKPTAALLPALDPTVMGWAERSWFLGEHRASLFDRYGNAGPTVWWDGRVVGGWAQRTGGEVVWRLLEDVGAAGSRAVEAAAHRLEAWLGPTRFTPRFRTPLERELVA